MIYRCPNCGLNFQSDVTGIVACPGCGAHVRVAEAPAEGCALDLAGRGNLVGAFFDVVKKSIVNPEKFFSEVAVGRGIIRPLLFAVVISVVIFIIVSSYQAGFSALSTSIEAGASEGGAWWPFVFFSIPLSIGGVAIFSVVAVPLAATVGLFVQAGIYHLCLMLLGAARRDFTATFRTVCYATSPQIFQVVPIFGSLVAPIWQLVLCIIGLKVVHGTSYGRSALAVFLPTILCCGLIVLAVIAVAGGIVAAFATKGF